eukprot:gene600-2025_t
MPAPEQSKGQRLIGSLFKPATSVDQQRERSAAEARKTTELAREATLVAAWTQHHHDIALDMHRRQHGATWYTSGKGAKGASSTWDALQRDYFRLFDGLTVRTTGNWVIKWLKLEKALAAGGAHFCDPPLPSPSLPPSAPVINAGNPSLFPSLHSFPPRSSLPPSLRATPLVPPYLQQGRVPPPSLFGAVPDVEIVPPTRERLLFVLAEAKVDFNNATKVAETLSQIHKKRPGRPQILHPDVYKAVQDYILARVDNGEIMAPITLRGPIRDLIREGLDSPTCSGSWRKKREPRGYAWNLHVLVPLDPSHMAEAWPCPAGKDN